MENTTRQKKYQYLKAVNPTEFSVFTGLGTTKLDLKTLAKDIPCQAACPAKTNVPAYIEKIFQGDHDAAYRINQEDNVFPGVLGRICTRPCEDACRYTWTNVDKPVQICHLKRTAADNFKAPPKPLKNWFEKTGKRVVVIGGGPAGLTAARELTRYGHSVTIYEREDHLGGMLADGIPKFRLPRETVDQEVKLIIDSGIEVKYNQPVDAAMLHELTMEFDAVLLSVGTTIPSKLAMDGIGGLEDIYNGLDFMKYYNNGQISKVQGDVVIIGGGFTAVDSARSCARASRKLLGVEGNVTIVYRRAEQHLSASFEEIEEIKHENIEILTLSTPLATITDKGKLKAVRFRRNILDDNTTDGKPRMMPVEGSEFDIPCSLLIIAIGQTQDFSLLGGTVELKPDNSTSQEKLFSAGDYLSGSKDVISAVADGKAAADRIDIYLTGKERKKVHVSVELIDNDAETGRVRDHDLQVPDRMPVIDLVSRAIKDREVEAGFKDDAIFKAASRCYLCHYKFEINQDKCIHCDWCIEVAPRSCIKRVSRIFNDKDGAPVEYIETSLAHEATYIYIDSNECIRCGKCLRVCPTEAITMRKMERVNCSAHDLNIMA